MSEDAASRERSSWLESCSFVQIFRTFRLAIHPTKLTLALVGLLLTLVWGGWLDWLWQRADRGVAPHAIWAHAGLSVGAGQPEGETAGVFESWRRYEAWCLGSALTSARHGNLWTSGPVTVVGSAPPGAGDQMPSVAPIGLARCVLLMGKGFAWLVTFERRVIGVSARRYGHCRAGRSAGSPPCSTPGTRRSAGAMH